MAYREVAMWEILNVLGRLGQGESKTSIAAATGNSRSTIRRYEHEALGLGWRPGTEESTEELAAEVGRRLSPARDRAPGDSEADLLSHQEQIRQWLTPPPGEERGPTLFTSHSTCTRTSLTTLIRDGQRNSVSPRPGPHTRHSRLRRGAPCSRASRRCA